MSVVFYLERLLFDLRLVVLVAAVFAVLVAVLAVRRSERDDSALCNVKKINNGSSKTHQRVLRTPKGN